MKIQNPFTELQLSPTELVGKACHLFWGQLGSCQHWIGMLQAEQLFNFEGVFYVGQLDMCDASDGLIKQTRIKRMTHTSS